MATMDPHGHAKIFRSRNVMKKPTLLILILLSKLLASWFAIHFYTQLTVVSDPFNYARASYSGVFFESRTAFIGNFAGLLARNLGENAPHYIFSMISGFAIWGLLIQTSWSVTKILLPLLFLPTITMWTGLVSKESLAASATAVVLMIWIQIIQRRENLVSVGILGLALSLYAFVRPHYCVGAAVLVGGTWILRPNIGGGSPFKGVSIPKFSEGVLCLFLFLILLITHKQIAAGLGKIISQALVYFAYPDGASSRNNWLKWSEPADFYYSTWWGIPFSIIGPLPSEVIKRPKMVFAFVEGLIIFLLPLAAFIAFVRKIKRTPDQNLRYLYRIFFIILPVTTGFLFLVHAPFGTVNSGSAVRYRVGFEYLVTITWLYIALEISRHHRNIILNRCVTAE